MTVQTELWIFYYRALRARGDTPLPRPVVRILKNRERKRCDAGVTNSTLSIVNNRPIDVKRAKDEFYRRLCHFSNNNSSHFNSISIAFDTWK